MAVFGHSARLDIRFPRPIGHDQGRLSGDRAGCRAVRFVLVSSGDDRATCRPQSSAIAQDKRLVADAGDRRGDALAPKAPASPANLSARIRGDADVVEPAMTAGLLRPEITSNHGSLTARGGQEAAAPAESGAAPIDPCLTPTKTTVAIVPVRGGLLTLIKPFRALRPAPGRAAEILAPRDDVLSRDAGSARARQGQALEFCISSKPEIHLYAAIDPYDAAGPRRQGG